MANPDFTMYKTGVQTVLLNTIGLHRGYTGHEMLGEFDIINMNGRLYDPVLGRFFSPDNYVQMPDNSQNFNRYSYCLNNPLKYTDPSGNLFGIDDAAIVFAAERIENATLRRLNQNLRNKRIPLNNWRTADKGHFHWKWGSKDRNEWFYFRK
jgi:RHS repeat-associated protein